MNIQVLIDSIVRQTTILIAQLATSAGARAPLAHVADQIQQLSGVRIPLLFADDFVAAASVGDLYYAFLGMPDSLQTLQYVLLPDPGTEVSLAFEKSGTSLGPRFVLRRSFRDGQRAYWQASDYGPSASDHSFVSNPGSFPLGGMEVIYELPNGLHAYYLADGDGQRVDTSPLSPLTIRDPSQSDQLVRNSVSCFGCHQGGIVPIGNQPPTDGVDTASLQALQFAGTADDDGYLQAVQSLGIARGTDPISQLFSGFVNYFSLGQAAAKLFVTPELISNQTARLPDPLRVLGSDFGSVSRSTFASNYMDAFCTLQHDSENHPFACPRDRRSASSAGGTK